MLARRKHPKIRAFSRKRIVHMSAAKRSPTDWLADQIVMAAVHHPLVPADEGYGAIWRAVEVRWSYSSSRLVPRDIRTYSYRIDLLTGCVLHAHVKVRMNHQLAKVQGIQRRQVIPSAYPVSCEIYFQHSTDTYRFTCEMVECRLVLTPEVNATVG